MQHRGGRTLRNKLAVSTTRGGYVAKADCAATDGDLHWNMLFCLVYFFRPEDFIPSLAFIPFAKITGAIACFSLFLALLSGVVWFAGEVRLMVALFGWFLVTIPFSSWRGGSFAVVCFTLSKVLIIAIATISAVNTLHRLRRLMLVHTLGMLTMASVAFGQRRLFGRMYGVGTMFADPMTSRETSALFCRSAWQCCFPRVTRSASYSGRGHSRHCAIRQRSGRGPQPRNRRGKGALRCVPRR